MTQINTKGEEEEVIIHSPPKKAARVIRGLWKSWTARVNAIVAAAAAAALSIPGIGDLWALGLSGLVSAVNTHIGLLLPALDPKTAAVTAFSVAMSAVILRARTAAR